MWTSVPECGYDELKKQVGTETVRLLALFNDDAYTGVVRGVGLPAEARAI